MRQRRRRSRAPRNVAIVLSALALALFVYYAIASSNTPKKIYAAPDFTLPIVNQGGQSVGTLSLSTYKGKAVLLEFMVPWCEHCKNMAPVLERLYSDYYSKGVEFLTASGPWSGATYNDAAQFKSNYRSAWPYVFDSSNKVFESYGVSGTPTFFVLSKDGQVSATFQGEVPYETLANALSQVM